MGKRHLTKEEREDILIVIEATQKLLPLFEQLSSASHLNEEETLLLEQIRQTLQDVLIFSGEMMQQIQILQFENALDGIFSLQMKGLNTQIFEGETPEGLHQSFVEYLKALVNEQAN